MRRHHRADHASRSARRANAFQIERHQHRLRIETGKAHVERVPQTASRLAISQRVGKTLRDSSPQLVSQSFLFLMLFLLHDKFCGRRHPRDGRDIFRSRSPLVLVSAAEHDRLDRASTSQKKQTSAFWSVKFMPPETGRINKGNVDVDLAEGLHHVAVQECSASATDFRNFSDWLNDPGFVVCGHDRNERRIVAN